MNMKLTKLLPILAMLFAFILSACGGSDGSNLGAFPALTKTVGDTAFDLTPPSSDSPGAFTYTSSNTAVATISGKTVSILSAGTSTITATQASSGKWGTSSVSALLTVNPRTCISPAVLANGVCTVLTMPGNFVMSNGISWMPVSLIKTWADANEFCTNTTINSLTGWRLPNNFELSELSKNVVLTDKNWFLSQTWTSTAGTAIASRKIIDLNTKTSGEALETSSAYFTCVK